MKKIKEKEKTTEKERERGNRMLSISLAPLAGLIVHVVTSGFTRGLLFRVLDIFSIPSATD